MSFKNSYSCYEDLARNEVRGKDFDIFISKKPFSKVAILAPHGGGIERRTSQIARLIAGDDFNLYLFEGLKLAKNHETLHLSSHLFDEPQCLALISKTQIVVTIHGCNGKEEIVYLGGLNEPLKQKLVKAFSDQDIETTTKGHKYPGKHPNNICNRGLTNQGIQIELTDTLRGTSSEEEVIKAIRKVLLEIDME